LVERRQQAKRIDRVNHGHEREGASGLVPLQVTDEVPANRPGDLSNPFGQLLRPILREVALPEADECLNPLRSSQLRHRDKCDVGDVTPGATARRRHPIENRSAVRFQSIANSSHRAHDRDSSLFENAGRVC
jgi:hypothetical protein